MCLLQCLNGLLSLSHVELSDPHSYVQGWTSEGMGVCNGHQGQGQSGESARKGERIQLGTMDAKDK